jgi:hypothetical protein
MPYVEAIIPHADQLIVADGLSYVRFQGLVFAHSAWTTPNNNVGFPELQANVAILDTNWGSFMPAGAITLRSAHDVTFERNVFLHLGGAGIEIMDSHDVTISGNHFTDISGNAIEFGDRDVTAPPTLNHDCLIANNYVHDTPVEYQGGVGIFVGQAHNITVRNNEIDDLPYTGISIGWGNGVDVSAFAGNHQVHKNLVQRAMKHMCDGGSFYSNAMQSASSVHDNVFLAQQHGGSALYLDQWSAYYSAYNNVIFDNPGAPMSTTARIKSGQFPNLGQKNDVTANYWQDRGLITPPCFTGPVPDVNATPPEQAHDNTTISALNQAPAYILDAAGLEDAYMDIKILPPMPPFQGEYDTNPPWGMLAGIPSPIYTVLTSVGYPAGTIAGAAFDNVGVTSVSVVIRRGTGYCDGTSSDWDGTAWVAACTVALPATFVPGASTTWTLTSTPPLGQMTPGQTYWVYVNLRDAINNASNWVPNTSTVFN